MKKSGADSYSVDPIRRDTQLLRREGRKYFTGSAKAFDATNSPDSLRFDPEGVRASHCGRTVFVSEEYGPFFTNSICPPANGYTALACRTSY